MYRVVRRWRNRLWRRYVNARKRITFYRDEVEVAPGSVIDRNAFIGRRTLINGPAYLDPCEIGSYCAIGSRLIVRSANHHTQFLALENDTQQRIIGASTLLGPREHVRIGHAVWIGDRVVVCPGVTVGNGAVIGAGSVVTRDVPDYAVVAGNPARVLRYRYPEAVIARIKDLEWWRWDDATMRRRRHLFEVDLATIPLDDLDRLLDELP